MEGTNLALFYSILPIYKVNQLPELLREQLNTSISSKYAAVDPNFDTFYTKNMIKWGETTIDFPDEDSCGYTTLANTHQFSSNNPYM